MINQIRKQIEPFETREFESQAKLEEEALKLYVQEKGQAIRFLARYSNNMAEQSVRLGNSMLN